MEVVGFLIACEFEIGLGFRDGSTFSSECSMLGSSWGRGNRVFLFLFVCRYVYGREGRGVGVKVLLEVVCTFVFRFGGCVYFGARFSVLVSLLYVEVV